MAFAECVARVPGDRKPVWLILDFKADPALVVRDTLRKDGKILKSLLARDRFCGAPVTAATQRQYEQSHPAEKQLLYRISDGGGAEGRGELELLLDGKAATGKVTCRAPAGAGPAVTYELSDCRGKPTPEKAPDQKTPDRRNAKPATRRTPRRR